MKHVKGFPKELLEKLLKELLQKFPNQLLKGISEENSKGFFRGILKNVGKCRIKGTLSGVLECVFFFQTPKRIFHGFSEFCINFRWKFRRYYQSSDWRSFRQNSQINIQINFCRTGIEKFPTELLKLLRRNFCRKCQRNVYGIMYSNNFMQTLSKSSYCFLKSAFLSRTLRFIVVTMIRFRDVLLLLEVITGINNFRNIFSIS